MAWVFLAVLLAGCGQAIAPPAKLGELVVMTRYSPTTYYLDQEGRPAGFEYELAKRFADARGWRLRLVVADTLDELLSALESRQAHLAAGWLAVTPDRQRQVRFGPSYAEDKEWVVCRKGIPAPRGLADMGTLRLELVAGSSHEETLKRLRRQHASLHWAPMPVAGEEELLERVANGLADCTVADEVSLNLASAYQADLERAFDLGRSLRIAWALPWRSDKLLVDALGDFFRQEQESGRLERLRSRHFGRMEPLDAVDQVHFLARRAERLPALRHLFQQAQAETGLDWRLLAAIAYQESQWDPRSVSPTGVRGIMMLTEETADRMGVRDRLDPRDSILGGARYVKMLMDALPGRIPEADRVWLAMFAYNLGMGHLEDARRLARSLGRNPDSWQEMRDVVPLIARAAYAGQLKYGYARGGEARHFLDNVRVFYDMMRRLEAPSAFGLMAENDDVEAPPGP